MIDVRALFEAELTRRGLKFSIDEESGRHAIEMGGGSMLVNLHNLQRDVESDQDSTRVVRFVDAVVASADDDRETVDASRLYWCFEPNDHVDRAEFVASISKQIDRVLCHWSSDGRLITWVTADMLKAVELNAKSAIAHGFENLDAALREATIEVSDIDGVKLGMLGTRLPFKSSLLLARNAREVLEPALGWPLLAVAPDRDFLYVWAERHRDFTGRVGAVALREYQRASYALSTEVFRLSDAGLEAIGAFAPPS